MKSAMYYEAHVTVAKMERVKDFTEVAESYGFHVSTFAMLKKEGREADAFCSIRGEDFSWMIKQVICLCHALRAAGFIVKRYKIEDTLIDSKFAGPGTPFDSLRLLGN